MILGAGETAELALECLVAHGVRTYSIFLDPQTGDLFAYAEIEDFEEQLTGFGIILVKYWLEVSPEEQTRRLTARIDDPRKIWKLSNMDLESYGRWFDCSTLKEPYRLEGKKVMGLELAEQFYALRAEKRKVEELLAKLETTTQNRVTSGRSATGVTPSSMVTAAGSPGAIARYTRCRSINTGWKISVSVGSYATNRSPPWSK